MTLFEPMMFPAPLLKQTSPLCGAGGREITHFIFNI